MNKNLQNTILLICLAVLFASTTSLAQTKPRLNLTRGAAGGSAKSSSHNLTAVIGQFTPPVRAESRNFILLGGFIYTLDLSAPNIEHEAVLTAGSGESITIRAKITDDTRVEEAILKYRQGGDSVFVSIPMRKVEESEFQETIPSSIVGSNGIEYAIEASDLDKKTNNWPPQSKYASIPINVINIFKEQSQPAGSPETDFRLVSIPLDLTDRTPQAVLQEQLGAYDPTFWRLFEWSNEKDDYKEFTKEEISSFFPGKSFFLIVAEDSVSINAGPGTTVRTDAPFPITLESKYNFIASPFKFPIPLANLRLESGGPVVLQTYKGNGWQPAAEMMPWEGYVLALNDTTTDRLLIDPDLSTRPSKPQAAKLDDRGWRVQIVANVGEVFDKHNFVGISAESIDDWDNHDIAEPPPIGEYISAYFPHPEWQKPLIRYATDIRSPDTPVHRWDFVVKSNIQREIITLNFEFINEIPVNLAIYLVDPALEYKQYLRQNNNYQLQLRSRETAKNLTLLVGEKDELEAQTNELAGVPDTYVLYANFPNPFNPETAIRFDLPVKSIVTLKIYDATGHEVNTLLENQELEAGRYQRIWYGRDAVLRAVATGIYFYRLTTRQGFSATIKMTLLK